jgi:uncharacterized protein YbjT (DUF2867 family)
MAKRPNENRLILVTGATGKQGGAVIRHLRAKGYPIRALTRNPDQSEARALTNDTGVEVARGDYEDKSSLLRALEDVYGVFSVQTPFPDGAEAEVRQGVALIDAAHNSGISHFIYSSVGSADQNTGIPHFESKWKIEEHLRTTGMPHTIVRPVYFMENWLQMKDIIDQRRVMLPLKPETILKQVAVDDIGAFVTMAFEHPGKWQGTATDLAGDESFIDQIAQTLQSSYSQISWDVFETQAGPEMTLMFQWFESVGYHADVTALRQEHPWLMSFERWRNTFWPAQA